MMAKTHLVAFLSGGLFSIGLGLSGMTQPQKVIGFLDVFGAWDLSLAFVMAGGVGSFLLLRLLIQRRFAAPVLGGAFQLPSRREIDRPLVIGAVLFGSGWGLGGYCPGPAITSLGSGSTSTVLFVAAMSVGMFLADRMIAPALAPAVAKS